MRAAVFSLVGVIILTVYGVEVCPFLESLGYPQLGLMMAVTLVPPALARRWWMPALTRGLDDVTRIRRAAWADLAAMVIAGAVITVFDIVVYDFPLASGLKLMVGSLMLGIFMALDIALAEERVLLERQTAAGQSVAARFVMRSLTRSLTLVSTAVLLLVGGVFFLVVSKDLSWMTTLQQDQLNYGKRVVLVEVVFVVGVLLALVLNLARSYAANLRLYFENQTRVLDRVARGHLDAYVPITGSNEFSLIASRTNLMIDELREKQAIKDVLGKVVSPEIARRLMADGGALGGTRRDLVILFSDIRGFTSFSETRQPEEVVAVLNRYFTAMVRIIREHGGLVDKFIGDGMLAVFGLENPDRASARAMQAAVAMYEASKRLTAELGVAIDIGVGIHAGPVIAGNVGSNERLEFTFIGDAVNTAARLEGMTKELGAPIVVSEAAWRLKGDADVRAAGTALGDHALKGKKDKVALWGLRPAAATA